MEMTPTGPILEKSWEKFPGHIAPALIFSCFGGYALLKTLSLTKELPAGRTFAEVHIPFRNKRIIRNIGTSCSLLTFSGMLYHAAGDGIDMSLKVHMIIYFCFLFAGLTAVLESYERLPPDSARTSCSLALLMSGFVWNSHGSAMMEPVNRNVHLYLGYINVANGLAFAYSIMQPSSIRAHIISWALFVVQGIWLFYIAFYLCCVELDEFMVEAHLALITVVVAFVIMVVIGASNLDNVRQSHRQGLLLEDGRGHYEIVTKTDAQELCGRSESTADDSSQEEDQC